MLGTADVKFYYALYKNDGSISFCIDGGDDNKLTTVQKLTITDVIPTFDINADVKLKVDFTKEGTIKICVNDVEVYSFTGYVPFGTQFGMLTEDGIGFEKNAVVGTLKSFTYVDPNAEVAE
ncbi:MAG: hypothetical protein E7626_05515 [Ruminococcaceae bacterium]|nr:hypothetical protein [Oscillospiraceae bacterium]